MRNLWFILALLSNVASIAQDVRSRSDAFAPDYVNFYGICWRGSAHHNLAYARQMGYKYVFYQKGMEMDSLSNGMYFYIETPEYGIYKREVSSQKVYSPEEIDFYESHCVLKDSNLTFPANLATGWISQPGSGKFTVLLDFQQQEVISWAVDSVLNYARAIEARNPKFKFAGYAWDEPTPSGDFWDVENGKRVHAKLEKWNKVDGSSRARSRIGKQFQTYTDGHLEYYRQLFRKTRQSFPNAHFISEPYAIYDSWIKFIKDRRDAREISPDILCQEGSSTMFVDDKRITASGLITRDRLLCTTPDKSDETINRTLAAKAAVNGSGFGWYGRFGGTGDMPDYKDITEVPPRLKLIRVLPAWENKNKTKLNARSWDGQIYKSNNAYASQDVIYLRQPETQKIFAVFLTKAGIIGLPTNVKLISIAATDGLFIETGNSISDFQVEGTVIRIKNESAIGKGYVLTVR